MEEAQGSGFVSQGSGIVFVSDGTSGTRWHQRHQRHQACPLSACHSASRMGGWILRRIRLVRIGEVRQLVGRLGRRMQSS